MKSAPLRALWLALVLLATPTNTFAQQSAPADAKVPAEEAFQRGEKAYDEKNFAEALRWYRTAADQGHAKSQVHIGNMYTEGEGVAQDYKEALSWFRKAAEQDDDEALNDIGWFYVSGWGVEKDYCTAIEWFRKAADKGNEVAQRNIGWMYLQGMGVPMDKNEGIRWFKKAAEAGDEDSKAALKQLGAE